MATSFPKGTAFTGPEGGLVLWVELPAHIDAAALQAIAFENGIAVAPGVLFSNTQEYKNYIRVSYGNAWSKKVENEMKRLGKLVMELG